MKTVTEREKKEFEEFLDNRDLLKILKSKSKKSTFGAVFVTAILAATF